jgi:hypothetical protein
MDRIVYRPVIDLDQFARAVMTPAPFSFSISPHAGETPYSGCQDRYGSWLCKNGLAQALTRQDLVKWPLARSFC